MSTDDDDYKSTQNNIFSLYSIASVNGSSSGQQPLSNAFTRIADNSVEITSLFADDDDDADEGENYDCTQLDDHVINRRILGEHNYNLSDDSDEDIALEKAQDNAKYNQIVSDFTLSASYIGTLNIDPMTAQSQHAFAASSCPQATGSEQEVYSAAIPQQQSNASSDDKTSSLDKAMLTCEALEIIRQGSSPQLLSESSLKDSGRLEDSDRALEDESCIICTKASHVNIALSRVDQQLGAKPEAVGVLEHVADELRSIVQATQSVLHGGFNFMFGKSPRELAPSAVSQDNDKNQSSNLPGLGWSQESQSNSLPPDIEKDTGKKGKNAISGINALHELENNGDEEDEKKKEGKIGEEIEEESSIHPISAPFLQKDTSLAHRNIQDEVLKQEKDEAEKGEKEDDVICRKNDCEDEEARNGEDKKMMKEALPKDDDLINENNGIAAAIDFPHIDFPHTSNTLSSYLPGLGNSQLTQSQLSSDIPVNMIQQPLQTQEIHLIHLDTSIGEKARESCIFLHHVVDDLPGLGSSQMSQPLSQERIISASENTTAPSQVIPCQDFMQNENVEKDNEKGAETFPKICSPVINSASSTQLTPSMLPPPNSPCPVSNENIILSPTSLRSTKFDAPYHLSPVRTNLVDYVGIMAGKGEDSEKDYRSDMGTYASNGSEGFFGEEEEEEGYIHDENDISYEKEEDKRQQDLLEKSNTEPEGNGWLVARSNLNKNLPFCEPVTFSESCVQVKTPIDLAHTKRDRIETVTTSDDEDNMTPKEILRRKQKSARLDTLLSQNGNRAVDSLLQLKSSTIESPPKSKEKNSLLLKRVIKEHPKKLIRLVKKTDYTIESDDNDDIQGFESPEAEDVPQTVSSKSPLKSPAQKKTRFEQLPDEAEFEWSPAANVSHTSPLTSTHVNPSKDIEASPSSPSHEMIDGDIPIQFVRKRHLLKTWPRAWTHLESVGWTWKRGNGLVDFYYIRPNKSKEFGFTSTEEVLAYINKCLEEYDFKHPKSADIVNISSITKTYASSPSRHISPVPVSLGYKGGTKSPLLPSSSSTSSSSSDAAGNTKWLDEVKLLVQEKMDSYLIYDILARQREVILEDVPIALCVFVDTGDDYFDMLLNTVEIMSSPDAIPWAPQYFKVFIANLNDSIQDSRRFADVILTFLEDNIVFEAKVEHMMTKGLKWANVWGYLDRCGWSCKRGNQLIDWFYLQPHKAQSKITAEYFDSIDSVEKYIRKKIRERPTSMRYTCKSESMVNFIQSILNMYEPRPQIATSSPSTSSPSSHIGRIEIEDWFENAMDLNWTEVIWPMLYENKWALDVTKTGERIILMPGVHAEIAQLGKNSFASEDDVKRYLLVLFTQWKITMHSKDSSHSKKGGGMRISLSSVRSADRKKRLVTPSDSGSNVKLASNLTFTPGNVSLSSKSNSTKRQKRKNSFGADFIGESQFDRALNEYEESNNQYTSPVNKNQKRCSKTDSFKTDPKFSPCVGDDDATQLQSPVASPIRPSPLKTKKSNVERNTDQQTLPKLTASSNAMSCSGAIEDLSLSLSYRALPLEATSELADLNLPIWISDYLLSNDRDKVFTGLQFVITGLPEDYLPASSNVRTKIMKNGGVILSSFPSPDLLLSGDVYEKTPMNNDIYLRSRNHGNKDDDANTTDGSKWVFDSLLVISHPNGCRRESYLLAAAYGVPIVHPCWVLDCIRNEKFVDPSGYQLPTAFSPIRPYVSFQRTDTLKGVFHGMRVLDLVSEIKYTDKEIKELSKANSMVFTSLLDNMKQLKTTDAVPALGWFSRTLLAAGATLCDPKREIPLIISAGATINQPKYERQFETQQKCSFLCTASSYIPPDIIVVDSLIFSDHFRQDGKKRSETTPRASIVLLAISKYESLIDYRDQHKLFKLLPDEYTLPRQRIAGCGHGVIVTTDYVSNCIGLNLLLPPAPGFIPKDVLAIDNTKFPPPQLFRLPDNSEQQPWSWRQQPNNERFTIGDYAIFKASTGHRNERALHIKGDSSGTLSLGRIVSFSRKDIDLEIKVRINLMYKSDEGDQAITRSDQYIVGNASDVIVKKAAVFSSKAFAYLKYCNAGSNEHTSPSLQIKSSKQFELPDPYIYCMSTAYEENDGFVVWTRLDDGRYEDEFQTYFFDNGQENGEENEMDEEDMCGGAMSQDYY